MAQQIVKFKLHLYHPGAISPNLVLTKVFRYIQSEGILGIESAVCWFSVIDGEPAVGLDLDFNGEGVKKPVFVKEPCSSGDNWVSKELSLANLNFKLMRLMTPQELYYRRVI